MREKVLFICPYPTEDEDEDGGGGIAGGPALLYAPAEVGGGADP
jgi:hypothetical protein